MIQRLSDAAAILRFRLMYCPLFGHVRKPQLDYCLNCCKKLRGVHYG